ncbi:MAG: (Fe-S)-binding protein [Gammaproteobacteria bacterium]|nr:(Fe-S)-binding protein [Gammaproteobacteria bacterium]
MSERFEQGVAALRRLMDARIVSYFSSCVHCGLCAEACLFYTETGDPKYTPIYKLEPMRKMWRQENTFWGKLGVKLGLTEPLAEQDLADWETLVYDSCTLCGRCSMVCPVGNDIAYMIRKEREGMVAAGYAPDGMKEATRRALEIGSPMGVTLKTLRATLKGVERNTGLAIPVDAQGAEYMTLFSSMEVVNFPEYIESIARIFAAAGVSWTISSEAFEATNSGIQIGDSKAAGELVGRVVSAAEKLGVQYVISPECGHAFTAIRWEGANLIGRPLPFKVIHILELLEQLREEGRLKLEGHTDIRLTFHDPCQIVRRGGVVEQPRQLLREVATEFVEMRDHGVMNWCCGGGGGVSANERAEPLRLQAFQRKKKQLDELGVETMVTACANCRIILEEGIEHYGMDVQVTGLTELLAEHLAGPAES